MNSVITHCLILQYRIDVQSRVCCFRSGKMQMFFEAVVLTVNIRRNAGVLPVHVGAEGISVCVIYEHLFVYGLGFGAEVFGNKTQHRRRVSRKLTNDGFVFSRN